MLAVAQKTPSINGVVRDADTYETLVGASIRVVNAERISAKSNEYGFYSISLFPDVYDIQVSYLGYKDTLFHVNLKYDQTINITLRPINTLAEVEIFSQKQRSQLENIQMGVSVLNVKEVERVPVIFGEKDILKTMQLMPGVLSAGEGSSGFFVRGGAEDQNLIILDEATVYNASHLFGFFSTFNSDAIKDATLYKGGMPAQYGGRLSSVLDVSMLDGNKKNYQVKGGIGLIASRLSIEGPLVQEKGSFMLSGRRTYADLFLKLSSDSAINKSSLYFYDLNLKANYQFNDNNTLYLSSYLGKDLLGYSDEFDFDWGNITSTLRWNHVFNPRLFSNLSLIYGNFDYNVSVLDKRSNFSIHSKIENVNIKQDFQFYKNSSNVFRFGMDLLRQKIQPAGLSAADDSQINTLLLESRKGLDLSAYVSHEWKVSNKLEIEYGLRVNNFQALGPGNFATYDDSGFVIESKEVGTNKTAESYFTMEPRISANFKVNSKNSFKLSFNQNVQNLHLLSNSTSTLPTDVWMMTSPNVRPQTATQTAFGYFRDFLNGKYEFSVESYYKNMQHQIELKDGAELQANPDLEADLLFGQGRAYGLEFFVKKRTGRFNGWISYTLSKSERLFDGINDGKWYIAKQDRPHDLNIVTMYEINPRLSLSSSFVFSSGQAVTFPSGKYRVDDLSVWYYTERNGYRMPNYHRLDLGLTLQSKPENKFNSSWTFGLYNAYNRKNAYIINFRESKEVKNKTEAYQIALFGIVPSITWNFNF